MFVYSQANDDLNDIYILYILALSILSFSLLIRALSLSLSYTMEYWVSLEYILTVIRPVTRNIACNRTLKTMSWMY